ncbi:hypothetical protein HK096_009719, partial [Nowakowskiella sp. JEL0078]
MKDTAVSEAKNAHKNKRRSILDMFSLAAKTPDTPVGSEPDDEGLKRTATASSSSSRFSFGFLAKTAAVESAPAEKPSLFASLSLKKKKPSITVVHDQQAASLALATAVAHQRLPSDSLDLQRHSKGFSQSSLDSDFVASSGSETPRRRFVKFDLALDSSDDFELISTPNSASRVSNTGSMFGHSLESGSFGYSLQRYATSPAILITNEDGETQPLSLSLSSSNLLTEEPLEETPTAVFGRPDFPDIEIDGEPATQNSLLVPPTPAADDEILMDFGVPEKIPIPKSQPLHLIHKNSSSDSLAASVISTRSIISVSKFKPEKSTPNSNLLHPDWMHKRMSRDLMRNQDLSDAGAMRAAQDILKSRKIVRGFADFE